MSQRGAEIRMGHFFMSNAIVDRQSRQLITRVPITWRLFMVTDSLRRRVEVSNRQVVRQAGTIRDARYVVARRWAELEKRMSNIERVLRFLTDTMLGLISAFLAIAGAALAGGSSNWHDVIGAGVLAFLIAMLIANFVFPSATRLYGQ